MTKTAFALDLEWKGINRSINVKRKIRRNNVKTLDNEKYQ